MWRFWNCIPRVVRQQFHGPRASAGVYCEEEKAEHEVDKFVSESLGGSQCQESRDQETPCVCVGPASGRGTREEGGAHQEHGDWWKRHCHNDFWSRFCGQQCTLEAVTWGTAVVLGLQLSRRPNLDNYLDLLKDKEKRQQWQGLLFRMAFAMPPGSRLGVAKSIVHQEDGEQTQRKSKTKPASRQPTSVTEDNKTLDDVMQDFESSCQQYAAVGSSVSAISAASQGHMTVAVEHLRLACRLGHAPAYFNLAVCYEMGLGMEKDKEQAAAYYRMAADVGHVQSIFNLALMTLKGEGGVVKDREEALQLLKRAAHHGLAQAQTYLGVYYTEDEDNQQDFAQAASFFQAAADQNDAEGQYFLGICQENGWGVESDDEEAARLYSAAAELGHDGAMYNIAAFHEYGLGGVRRDEEEAMKLYKRSAELGNESAKFRLQEVEARLAVNQWSEQDSAASSASTDTVPSPGLRRSPHSSSPTLTDYLRESLTYVLVGGLSAWPSSDSVHSEGHNRATFTLGGQDNFSADDQKFVAEKVSYNLMELPQRVSIQHSCLSGLHRTSTMPELRGV
ncbi:DAP3-binding cell death enhancer 1-like [Littorina saxatilis]|uniref:Death ligand signal enhancer n=1 Tax=Littorina saxatilis TaxID=31220 RepID=A0AAN9B1T9_9CAEN